MSAEEGVGIRRRKRSAPSRKLSIEQMNAMCRRFLVIGETIFSYADTLEASGFRAFVPYNAFIQSFCSCQADVDLHRRCLIEGAKNYLGRPWSLVLQPGYRRHLYFSPFLRQLLDERDKANGVPESELGVRYPREPWRREVDPCERLRLWTKATDGESYGAKWKAMLAELRRVLESETLRHATGRSAQYGFDPPGRLEFFKVAMEDAGAALGFRYNARESFGNYRVFTKSIVEGWQLFWTIHDDKLFLDGPLTGSLEPVLGIGHAGLKTSLGRAEAGEFMDIRFWPIVPGFAHAYRKFRNLDQLETIIKAHALLYSLIAPVIEMSVRDCLAEGSELR